MFLVPMMVSSVISESNATLLTEVVPSTLKFTEALKNLHTRCVLYEEKARKKYKLPHKQTNDEEKSKGSSSESSNEEQSSKVKI